MKANVDLTLNRDFRSFKDFNIIDKYIVNHKFIWDDVKYIVNSMDDFKDDELFLTGDQAERRVKKYNLLRENECDRCGATLNKFPWHRECCLCHKCEQILDEDYKKIPWDKSPRL